MRTGMFSFLEMLLVSDPVIESYRDLRDLKV